MIKLDKTFAIKQLNYQQRDLTEKFFIKFYLKSLFCDYNHYRQKYLYLKQNTFLKAPMTLHIQTKSQNFKDTGLEKPKSQLNRVNKADLG